MTTLMRNPRVREGLGNFVLVYLSVGIVVLYSSYQRPLWIDEVLHYAWGGFSNPLSAQVIDRVRLTTTGINHGQTGVHMWLNGVSLQLSADSLLLRLPVVISGALVLIFAVWLIRAMGYSFNWQVICLLALGASSFLMYYVGESRPYLPLAAGVVATTTYFVSAVNGYMRKALTWAVWPIALLCSVWHPYFFAYVLALWLFAGVLSWWQRPPRPIDWVRCRPILILVLVSLALAVVAALATWRSGPLYRSEEMDPFEFTRPNGGFLTVWVDTHFQFLPLPGFLAPFVLVAVIALLILFVVLRFSFRPDLSTLGLACAPPLGLIVLALAISGVLSAISLYQNYWILNRQWVASLALVPIGTVWFLAALYTFLRPRMKWTAYGLATASFLVIGALAAYRLYGQVGVLQGYAATAAEYREKYTGVTIADSQRLYDELGPVEAANVNVYLGGPVWPVFSCTYGCEEGYQDRYR